MEGSVLKSIGEGGGEDALRMSDALAVSKSLEEIWWST